MRYQNRKCFILCEKFEEEESEAGEAEDMDEASAIVEEKPELEVLEEVKLPKIEMNSLRSSKQESKTFDVELPPIR